jgi:hypothetical protein
MHNREKRRETHNHNIRSPPLNLPRRLPRNHVMTTSHVTILPLTLPLLLQPLLGFLTLRRSGRGMVVPFFRFDAEADELADVEVAG